MNSSITYLKKLELFKELDQYREGQFFAVIDLKLKNHLPQWVQFSPYVYWLKHPEAQKTLETFRDIGEFFLKQGIHRSSVIYAIGGGATTDLAGFVAATLLRGISWVSVPTTLLGMVDAGIGGKVGVNMPQGKNLVGAFHTPVKVSICGDFLSTLGPDDWASGKGEVLKYGFLSKEVNALILKRSPIEEIAHTCATHKELVVAKDFRETGERILLNLGHTLGHAFESSLKLPHGLAVAMGIRYLHEIMGINIRTEWEKLMSGLELPLDPTDLRSYPQFELKLFLAFLEQDKKKVDQTVRLVLVKDIGSCYVEEILLKDLKAKIQQHEHFIR